MFAPEVGLELQVGAAKYRVAEHPAAPGMPYGQEGRQAVVYLLEGDSKDRRALKAFKPRYRIPALVGLADDLANFADLPGLTVCRRIVLSSKRHGELLAQWPDLVYAVLMPWVEGPSWMQVMLDKRELSSDESLSLARCFAAALVGLEEHGIAHCDLSASNVLLPALASAGAAPDRGVELVDVEQVFARQLLRPEFLTSGSPGYAHPRAPGGLWAANADRFAGAIILAEMLGWCSKQVREAAWGESYFDPAELQQDSKRCRLLTQYLRTAWGGRVGSLLERTWLSDSLGDCPSLGEWLAVLPMVAGEQASASVEVEEEVRHAEEPAAVAGDPSSLVVTWKSVLGDEEGERQTREISPMSTAQPSRVAARDADWREGAPAERERPPGGVDESRAESVVEGAAALDRQAVAQPARTKRQTVSRSGALRRAIGWLNFATACSGCLLVVVLLRGIVLPGLVTLSDSAAVFLVGMAILYGGQGLVLSACLLLDTLRGRLNKRRWLWIPSAAAGWGLAGALGAMWHPGTPDVMWLSVVAGGAGLVTGVAQSVTLAGSVGHRLVWVLISVAGAAVPTALAGSLLGASAWGFGLAAAGVFATQALLVRPLLEKASPQQLPQGAAGGSS